MATGRIADYDAKKHEGYIIPDTPHGEHDKIPFDKDALKKHQVTELKDGDIVSFDIIGGMIGLMAKDIRLISSSD
ncbi:MAG TPA: hypothetical protein VKP65_14770 [Rhodothermales bacterium]|nr:hypothetical protein [Rhodothermales bacterium]